MQAMSKKNHGISLQTSISVEQSCIFLVTFRCIVFLSMILSTVVSRQLPPLLPQQHSKGRRCSVIIYVLLPRKKMQLIYCIFLCRYCMVLFTSHFYRVLVKGGKIIGDWRLLIPSMYQMICFMTWPSELVASSFTKSHFTFIAVKVMVEIKLQWPLKYACVLVIIILYCLSLPNSDAFLQWIPQQYDI